MEPSKTVYLALHEERYPFALFATRDAAEEWIRYRPEGDYEFTIEETSVRGAPVDRTPAEAFDAAASAIEQILVCYPEMLDTETADAIKDLRDRLEGTV